MKRLPMRILNYIVSLGLLGLFLSMTDLSGVVRALDMMDWHIYAAAFGIFAAALAVNAWKWQLLLPAIAFRRIFAFGLIAMYYSLVLPGQLSGEAVKIYKLGRGRKDAETIAASVLVDRVTGLIGLTLVGYFGIVLTEYPAPEWLDVVLLGCIVCLALALYSMRIPLLFDPVQNLLRRGSQSTSTFGRICLRMGLFLEAWKTYLARPGLLLKSIAVGGIYQIMCVAITYVLAMGFQIEIRFVDWAWIFSVVSVLLVLPFTVGGLGLREGAFIGLLGLFGVPNEKALVLSFSVFSLQILAALAGLCIDLARPRNHAGTCG